MKIIIFSLFISLFAYSNSEELNTCEKIQKIKNSSDNKNNSPFLKVIGSLFKKRKIKENEQQVITDIDRLVMISPAQKRSVIILFKPLVEQEEIDEAIGDQEKTKEILKTLNQNLKKLVSKRKLENCLKIYDQYPVTEDEYNYHSGNLRNNRLAIDSKGLEKAREQIDKAKKANLVHNWEVIDSLDQDELSQLLTSNTVENLVIVGHSSSSGFLIDSNGNIVAPSIFKRISPSVRSISIFSCYGRNVSNNYPVLETFKSEQSAHLTRRFSTIEDSSMGEKTPINVLGKFLRRLDKDIAKNYQATIETKQLLPFFNLEKLGCSLRVSSSNESRNFNITINGFFIGNPGIEEKLYHFPCSIFKEEKNMLLVTSNSYERNKANNQYNVELQFDAQIISEKSYQTDDDSFDGRKIIFEVK